MTPTPLAFGESPHLRGGARSRLARAHRQAAQGVARPAITV